MTNSKQRSFEKKLSTLESLIDKLEQGDLPLEQALKEFESGVKLARQCQEELQAAEQKIEILMKNSKEAKSTAYNADNEEDTDE